MREHTITSPIHATHDEWYVCKSTTHALHIRFFKPKLYIGSQNPRLISYKPWRSLIGLTKPRATHISSPRLDKPKVHPWWVISITKFHLHRNSRYVRSTLDDLLYSKFLSMQEYKYIKNPRSTLGTHSCKIQGLPSVCTPTKPKASPWFAHSQQLWWPSPKVQV